MTKAAVLGLITSVLFVATSASAGWQVVVPELDPGSASLGVTLLVGGWLVLSGRRRKR
jgi:hypothetical protein